MKKKDVIRIRDPFVLTNQQNKTYYLFGTTDENVWDGKGTGFDVYKSSDLEYWEGPFQAFRPLEDFWADHHFWAPEVHEYDGKFYMLATFKANGRCRGTQILMSVKPLGPYIPITDKPVTPENWECLDGTLFTDENNDPWMIFCHEWLQIQDGEICAIRLSKDLKEAISEPVILFKGSQASWTVATREVNYVTDGPFLYRNHQGELLMLWSSIGEKGYAMGIARSQSGGILGPWIHDEKAMFDKDGGHGMLFKTFDHQLMLAIHTPNKSPNERPAFYSISERDGKLVLQY